MPIHNVQCPGNDDVSPQAVLSFVGPLLMVEVSVPTLIAQVLQKEKKLIPNPITGKALIDTGAQTTCVDEGALKALGLLPVGQIGVSTPDGSNMMLQYPVKLEFPASPIPPLEFNSVIGANLKDQDIIALIGRDILSHCILIMNGPAGSYSISF